ncbi:MAG: hypothetical protein ACRBFS_22910 [Aureispira sp.]
MKAKYIVMLALAGGIILERVINFHWAANLILVILSAVAYVFQDGRTKDILEDVFEDSTDPEKTTL